MKRNFKTTLLFSCLFCFSWAQKSTIDVSYMDQNETATDDFFMFANGTWVANNEIPPSESRWGSFNELDKANKIKLKAILTGFEQMNAEKGSDAQLLGDFYSSYINMRQRNAKGFTEVGPYFERIKAVENYEELTVLMAEFKSLGLGALFGFGVGQDLKDVESNIYYLSQGGIGLPNKEYYTEENKKEIRSKYQVFISDMFSYFTGLHGAAIAQDLIKLETALAEKMFAPAELRIPENTYNKMSYEEVIEMMTPFDFDLYVNTLQVSKPDSVVVSTPNFFKNMNNFASVVYQRTTL